jgi:hypothetical protein
MEPVMTASMAALRVMHRVVLAKGAAKGRKQQSRVDRPQKRWKR